MPFPIRPGKVTCAGLVGVLMVLPNSVWKGPDANATVTVQKSVELPRPKTAKTIR